MTAQPIVVPLPDEIIAVIRDDEDMLEAFRTIKDRLQLSNAFCEQAIGWGEGRLDKYLGPSATKGISPQVFKMLCWLFGVKFEMKIDLEQVRAMEANWQARDGSHHRKRPNRIGQRVFEQAFPLLQAEWGRRGGKKAQALRTASHRTEAARNAAQARWRAVRRKKRQAKRSLNGDAASSSAAQS